MLFRVTRLRSLAVATALASAATLTTVAVTDDSPEAPREVLRTVAGEGSADDPVRWVVAVSIDGLNPDAIRQLGPTGAPALHRMIRDGASTLDARTARERTVTLPNHTGMLTGRRVNARRGGHGVSFNDDEARTTVHRTAGEYAASVFDVVHDAGRRTALFAGKEKFRLFDRTWSEHGRRDRTGANDGRDKIDRFVVAGERRLTGKVVRELRERPRPFTFLHLAAPDLVGHQHGYMGREYLDSVAAMDRQVGRIMDAIAGSRRLRRHTVLLLTSDHGGLGYSHSDRRAEHNYTVPFLAWGVNVPRGADLYELNPDFAHPGDAQPRYGLERPPIRNAALANLATDLLDLARVPGSQINRRQDLDVVR